MEYLNLATSLVSLGILMKGQDDLKNRTVDNDLLHSLSALIKQEKENFEDTSQLLNEAIEDIRSKLSLTSFNERGKDVDTQLSSILASIQDISNNMPGEVDVSAIPSVTSSLAKLEGDIKLVLEKPSFDPELLGPLVHMSNIVSSLTAVGEKIDNISTVLQAIDSIVTEISNVKTIATQSKTSAHQTYLTALELKTLESEILKYIGISNLIEKFEIEAPYLEPFKMDDNDFRDRPQSQVMDWLDNVLKSAKSKGIHSLVFTYRAKGGDIRSTIYAFKTKESPEVINLYNSMFIDANKKAIGPITVTPVTSRDTVKMTFDANHLFVHPKWVDKIDELNALYPLTHHRPGGVDLITDPKRLISK